MDFKQLEAFVAVAKLKSYSKAADYLYLTQPTITARINSLEKELGVNLIVRSTRNVVVSGWGEVLYEYAVDMLNLRDTAQEYFRNAELVEKSTISIAASTIPAQYVLPQLMSAFRSEHPYITFTVNEHDSQGVVESITEQRAEIGFTGTKSAAPRCVFAPFMEDSLIVIAPNSGEYQALSQPSVSASWLRKQPFVVREAGSGTRMETERFLRSMGIDWMDLDVVAQVSGPQQVLQLVSRGMGVAILSMRAARDAQRRGDIKTFTVAEQEMQRRLYIMHHKNRPLSPAAKTFVKFAKSYSGQLQER